MITNKKIRASLLLALLICLCIGMCVPAHGEEPDVIMDVSDASAMNGDSVSFKVSVSGEFCALRLSISYDEELLEFVSAEEGDGGGSLTVLRADEESPLIELGTASGENFTADNGELAVLNFTVKSGVSAGEHRDAVTATVEEAFKFDGEGKSVELVGAGSSGKLTVQALRIVSDDGSFTGSESFPAGKGFSVTTTQKSGVVVFAAYDESGKLLLTELALPQGEAAVFTDLSAGENWHHVTVFFLTSSFSPVGQSCTLAKA